MGKTTVLKLLARVTSRSGFVWYPDRLARRVVDSEPLLFDAPLMANLRFGGGFDHPERDVWALCVALGVSRPLIGSVNRASARSGVRESALAHSDRVLICLARALLSGPHLLLVAGALAALGPVRARRARCSMSLKKLAEQRGLPTILRAESRGGSARARATRRCARTNLTSPRSRRASPTPRARKSPRGLCAMRRRGPPSVGAHAHPLVY